VEEEYDNEKLVDTEIDLTKEEALKEVQKQIEEREKEITNHENVMKSITKNTYRHSAANADIALKMVIYSMIVAIYDTQARGLYGYFAFFLFTFLTLLLVSAKVERGPLANWLQKPIDKMKDNITGRGKK